MVHQGFWHQFAVHMHAFVSVGHKLMAKKKYTSVLYHMIYTCMRLFQNKIPMLIKIIILKIYKDVFFWSKENIFK